LEETVKVKEVMSENLVCGRPTDNAQPVARLTPTRMNCFFCLITVVFFQPQASSGGNNTALAETLTFGLIIFLIAVILWILYSAKKSRGCWASREQPKDRDQKM
jgi:hypothetical protein